MAFPQAPSNAMPHAVQGMMNVFSTWILIKFKAAMNKTSMTWRDKRPI
jgi:hypothetical protein